jgi:hypothetical protein
MAKGDINNPMNIRDTHIKWLGENDIPGDEFDDFISPEYGFRAGFVLLYHYIKHGYNTLAEIITRYAPPEDNNPTEEYIRNVSDWSMIDWNSQIDVERYISLAVRIVSAMARQEQGTIPDPIDVDLGFQLFMNDYFPANETL